MKYFIGIELTKENIKSKYKELVKKFHPDLHKDETKKFTQIMQEINAEFEEALLGAFNGSIFYTSAKKKANREIADFVLRYFFKDKNRDMYIAYEQYSRGMFFNDTIYIIGKNKISRPGLYFVKISKIDRTVDDQYPYDYEYRVDEAYPAEEVEPEDLAKTIISEISTEYDISRYTFHSIFVMNIHNRLVVTTDMYDSRTSYSSANVRYAYGKDKNGNVQVCMLPSYLLNKAKCTDKMQVIDLIFYLDNWKGLGCYTLKEFREMYDTDVLYRSVKDEAFMGYQKIDKHDFMVYTESAVVMAMIRYGIIEIYQSKYKPQLMFGYINEGKLFASKFTSDDVNEAQDFLTEMNNTFEDTFKRMCRKGVIKINI